MPLNAASAAPLRGPNTRMTLNGDIIETPSTPSAPPMGGNYRPAAPRPSYGASSVRVEPRSRSGGSTAAIVVVLLLLLGGGGFGGYYWWSHRSNPKDAAQKYFTAFKAQDWKTVYELTEQTDQTKQMYTSSQDFADKAGKIMSLFSGLVSGLNFEAQDTKDNDGTTATVPIKISGTAMGQSVNQSVDLKLKNVDGAWKVSGGQSMGGMPSFGGMGGGNMGGGRMGSGMGGFGGR
jgi:hypothetical protein